MREFKGSNQLGTLADEVLDKWVNGFILKPYQGPMPRNPFKQLETGTKEVTGESSPTMEPMPLGKTDN